MPTETHVSVRDNSAHVRWPGVAAFLSVGGLFYVLPERLAVAPGWLVLGIVVVFAIGLVVSQHAGISRLNDTLAYVALAITTLALIGSVGLLIAELLHKKDAGEELLRGAVALWFSNILLFASWYWRLDGGGPNERERRGVHSDGAFLFPQMAMSHDLRRQMEEDQWSPGFVDYLFLAFNTSTALSPTDAPVLSRWAKAMMMVQATISLATVVLLAARAVNIL